MMATALIHLPPGRADVSYPIARNAVWIVCLAAALAQPARAQPKVPPIWPGPSFDPREGKGQYVYLTPERNAVVVYDPRRVEKGFGARCWLIPLLNEAKPRLSVEIRRTRDGNFEYRYTLENQPEARTPIGRFDLAGEPDDPHWKVRHEQPNGRGWGCSQIFTALPRIAVQVALPGAPKAAYVGCFHYGFTNLIYPGQSLSGFVFEASYRPGFTTAYIGPGKGRDLDLEMELPGEIVEILDEQLFSFLSLPEWREQHVLTVGPRYAPGAERAVIVREFLTGIEQWISTGRLEARSPFVAAVRAALQAWDAQAAGTFAVPDGARTQAERELQTALQFTLGRSVH